MARINLAIYRAQYAFSMFIFKRYKEPLYFKRKLYKKVI